MYISVPIAQKSSYELIADTRIDNTQGWARKMIKSIRVSYSRADYFSEVMPLLEDILSREYETISELNAYSIRAICDFLDIKTEIVSDCTCYLPIEDDLKLVEQGDYSPYPYMELTRPIKKVARAIALCKKEGVSEFINAIGGMELYAKEEFEKYGINIRFIKMDEIRYSQKCNDGSFEPNLSIIDVLMHNGKERTKELLGKYSLV